MKETTKNDYIQSIYKTVFYIEAHYAGELTLEELAKIAGFSKYHFHNLKRLPKRSKKKRERQCWSQKSWS